MLPSIAELLTNARKVYKDTPLIRNDLDPAFLCAGDSFRFRGSVTSIRFVLSLAMALILGTVFSAPTADVCAGEKEEARFQELRKSVVKKQTASLRTV